jgi:sulfocyanin
MLAGAAYRLRAVAVVLTLVTLLAQLAVGDTTRQTPSWMKSNAEAKLVTLEIVAGFNANNSALNFNGYFAGDMSVIVPIGWTVEIKFRNNDAMLPHSLVVTRAFPRGYLPGKAGIDEVAIPHAYTDNPEEGIPSPKTDTVRFVVRQAGEYYFFCGAPGHGQGGMWTVFKVDAAATAPYVTISPNAERGRS